MGLHGRAVPGGVYRTLLARVVGDDLSLLPDPSAYAQAVIQSMAPRDAVEEMLIAQLLVAHARAMRLTVLAGEQTGFGPAHSLHEYADRASNTYRRLMLALAEYRRPARAGDLFTVVKQAIFAGQQVIQNNESPKKNATNEQGFDRTIEQGRPGTPRPAGIPAYSGRPGVASFVRPTREAVDSLHRPADTGGQSHLAAERHEAR
jgi:hypothetical protein